MLKMVDGTGIIGVDMICPLGISTPQPPNYDRVEMEGTGMLVLPNSLDAPLERLELGGKTEQVQTSGKQMLNEELLKSLSNYTSNGSDYYYHRISGLEVGKKYTISRGYVKTGKNALLGISVNQESTNKAKFLVYDGLGTSYNNASITWEQTTGEYVDILFSVSGSVTSTTQEKLTEFWERLSYVQLEEGSTATANEPYTGGKPSPSPEYQQEIKNSGKWNEETQKYEVDVKITGKNLFDMNKFIDTCNFTKNEDGTFIIDKYVERYDCFIPANTILSIEVLKVEDSSGAAALELFYEDGENMYIGFGQVGVKTFLIQKDVAYIKVLAYRKHEYKYIQLEKGRTATPYEPYKEQTLTLTSDRPITKWDRLVEQGGEIGWLYGGKKYTVTGNEVFQRGAESYYTGSSTDMFYVIPDATGSEGIMKDLSFIKGIWNYTDKEAFCVNVNQLHIRLYNKRIGVSDDATMEEKFKAYKAFVAKRYADGTPFEVYYKTTKPEFVPLPQSEQNAIRALKTYYPTTVITADGGELDPDIKVTYRKEI